MEPHCLHAPCLHLPSAGIMGVCSASLFHGCWNRAPSSCKLPCQIVRDRQSPFLFAGVKSARLQNECQPTDSEVRFASIYFYS